MASKMFFSLIHNNIMYYSPMQINTNSQITYIELLCNNSLQAIIFLVVAMLNI